LVQNEPNEHAPIALIRRQLVAIGRPFEPPAPRGLDADQPLLIDRQSWAAGCVAHAHSSDGAVEPIADLLDRKPPAQRAFKQRGAVGRGFNATVCVLKGGSLRVDLNAGEDLPERADEVELALLTVTLEGKAPAGRFKVRFALDRKPPAPDYLARGRWRQRRATRQHIQR
jgi:hypothetical protein